MYNGIGLQTARGSGTNGYVQRNLSFVKQTKKPIEYKSEDDFKRLERELNRVPNKDILEHQNKRQIELKCLEMEDQMEQQGFTAQEIEAKVKEFRETLKHKMESSVLKKTEWLLENFPQNVKETHQMAEVNHQKNDLLKTVLKIGPNFIEGSSLDPTRKAREAAAKQEQQKKYLLVKEPSPEKEIKNNKIDTKEDKNKHKNIKKSESHKRKSSKHSSDSDSDSDSVKSYSSDDSHRKRKKSKSKDKRTKDSKRQKSKDRKSRKHKKYSDSSSGSDSDSDSDSSSDTQSESNDSSDDSHHKSRNGRRNERSKRERPKRSPSPETDRNRSKSYAELKESTHDFDDNIKTSHSIAMNIRQMRKEAQNFVALDKQHNPLNDSQKPKEKIETKRDHKELSPKTRESPRRRYSRSSSRSSERDSRVKRLKSAVYETTAAKKIREVPKSYDDHRYDSKKERSLSPKNRSRHSSHSQRSRSRSVHSYDSKSSNRSSRSRSSSSSKSSTKSSKSSSRSESRSRSPSIPRRKGSPSFLDKRRITSARKRPIPYRRGSPNSSLRSSRSSRSQSGCSSRSLSVSSSDSFNSNTYKLI